MRPSCILKNKMASSKSLGDSIATTAFLENADDEKEVVNQRRNNQKVAFETRKVLTAPVQNGFPPANVSVQTSARSCHSNFLSFVEGNQKNTI